MRTRRLFTFLIGCGVATFAFGGVAFAGGELSKSEYKEEINGICADANDEINVLFEEAFGDLGPEETPDEDDLAAVLEEVIPIFRDSLDDVEDLNGPNKLEKKVKALVDDYRDIADEVEDDPSILLGDVDPFAEADETALELGLDTCAEG